jgi:hypothetical protein
MSDPVKPVNVNPTPKARFQLERNNLTGHRALIEHAAFDKSADAALLEYQKLLAGQAVDGNSAMSAGFRAQGAVEFLSIFKTLAEQTQMPTPRRDMDNLPATENLKRQ